MSHEDTEDVLSERFRLHERKRTKKRRHEHTVPSLMCLFDEHALRVVSNERDARFSGSRCRDVDLTTVATIECSVNTLIAIYHKHVQPFLLRR